MHKVAPAIERAAHVPFIDLVDVIAAAVQAAGMRTVGLLGTAFTMEQDFYGDRLTSHGLDVLALARRSTLHAPSTCGFIRDLGERGAEGVVLGCTEIELLVSPADTPLPLFATTALHAAAVVDAALA